MPCRRLILSILGAWGIVLSNSSSAAGLATVKRCQSKTLAYSPRSSGDWLPWRWSLAVSSSTNVGDDTQVDFGNSPEPLPLQQPLTTALLRVSYDGMHFTGWSCANDNANDSSPIDHASSGRLVVAPLGSSRRRHSPYFLQRLTGLCSISTRRNSQQFSQTLWRCRRWSCYCGRV
jgi:hypothetical protein